MQCKLLGCDERADTGLLTPFGYGNFCRVHAHRVIDHDHDVMAGVMEAFRYGPAADPHLGSVERGPEFAHPNGLGAA